MFLTSDWNTPPRPDIHLEPAGGQQERKPVLMLLFCSTEASTATSAPKTGSLNHREEEGSSLWKAGTEHSGAWDEGSVPFCQVSFQREGQNESQLLPLGTRELVLPTPNPVLFPLRGTSCIISAWTEPHRELGSKTTTFKKHNVTETMTLQSLWPLYY